MTLNFQCAQTGCRFGTVETCRERMAHAKEGVFLALTTCAECKGPVDLQTGEIRHVQARAGKKKWNTAAERAEKSRRNINETHRKRMAGLV